MEICQERIYRSFLVWKLEVISWERSLILRNTKAWLFLSVCETRQETDKVQYSF